MICVSKNVIVEIYTYMSRFIWHSGFGNNKQPEKTYNESILEFISKKKEIIERYIDR